MESTANTKCGKGISTHTVPTRCRYFCVVVTVFGGSLLLIVINDSPDLIFNRKTIRPPPWYEYSNEEMKYSIKTEGCTIPALQPMNNIIKEYVNFPTDLKPCPNANVSLLEHNKTHIWVSEDYRNLRHFNVMSQNFVTCCYSSFYRPSHINDISNPYLDNRIQYNDCIYFRKIIAVKDEFVRVSCYSNEKQVYDQFILFAPRKNITLYDYAKEISTTKVSYNVLILGIDNLSRLNFHRTMPKTAAFFKERNAVELLGYNKVGENSYPNLVPLLLGHDIDELKKICHPFKKSTFDDCPFLWHWYKKAGYYTAFGEDSAFLGTFNYFMSGFYRTPTDYYSRPFFVEAEKKGAHKPYNAFLCMNKQYFYKVLLDYVENVTQALKSSRLFGFFWEVTMSHDLLNYPMVMDDNYEKFFKRLESSKYLDETIIVLMSDHGIRWGPIRRTRQGYFEERLPLAYLLMPPSFSERYSQAFYNLKQNSRRLSSPFDLHETLLDLIDLKNVEDETIKTRSGDFYTNNRGISLFLQIPGNRTCKTAGIVDHWCTCHRHVSIPRGNKIALYAAKMLVKHINLILVDHPECSKLAVDEVLKAGKIVANLSVKVEKDWKEYTVLTKLKPGGGIFEGTLRFNRQWLDWTVIGTVSRLNLYGKQSSCIHDSFLKLYCFCKS